MFFLMFESQLFYIFIAICDLFTNSPSYLQVVFYYFLYQTNSGALVRKRTIPTERPPHVGEVSANFSG
jgi:hypothetical protein